MRRKDQRGTKTTKILSSSSAGSKENEPGKFKPAHRAGTLADDSFYHTQLFGARSDQTMQELRAMLIYNRFDPRGPVRYPIYDWFKTGSKTQLKPTT